MPIKETSTPGSNRNLKRLFQLRTLVISGELIALLGIRYLTDIQLPLAPLLTILALHALINIWTWKRAQVTADITDGEFFAQLTVDVAALTGVLYYTGGATNPFAWFFLIPLMIAATVLSRWATWLMAGLTIACYSLLMFRFLPLDGQAHAHYDSSFSQHVFGMWFGFVLSAGLVAWFIVGMAHSLRDRNRALAKAREHALRDEQLVALGTLATGAAHELGTPLATMAVITGELKRQNNLPEAVQRKMKIMHSQVLRCKEALSVISASAGETQAESGSVVTVNDFLEQTISLWKSQRVDAELKTVLQASNGPAQILNERTLQQSIINLLNNAADVSPDNLILKANWDDKELNIEILDRGPGLHPDTNQSIGRQQSSNKEHGMGLGLFLTHATIQRLGGSIDLYDRDGGGTCTRVSFPLISYETK